jgi:ankyrin repeat protein
MKLKFRVVLSVIHSTGFLPLHVASRNKQHDIISTLIDAGADVNARDATSGRTALFHAAEANDVATCRVLLERRADPNVANFAGETAVYAASGRKHNQVVSLLVKYGADTCMPSSSVHVKH